MPDMVSVQEFARKIRERRPDLGQIPDITLVGKTLQAAPELRQYVDLSALPGTNAPPSDAPDARSGWEVAQDQAANAIKGIPQAITGIPSMVAGLGSIAADTLMGKAESATRKTGQMLQGAIAPVTTPLRGLGALVAPNTVQAPTQPEWENAAQGAGAMLGSAALGLGIQKAAPYVKQGVQNLGRTVQNAVTSAPTVNKWMGANPREMQFGADPGMQIKSEKLLGATKEATHGNVGTAMKDAGAKMQAKFDAAKAQGLSFDAEPHVINALDDATKRIGLKTDAAFQGQLNNVLTDILKEFPDINQLSPERMHALKVRVAESVKWSGVPYEADLNQALVKIIHNINTDLKTQIPGLDVDMSRWGNLYQAQRNLSKGITADKAGAGTGTSAPGSVRKIGAKAVKAGLVGGGGLAAYKALKD